MTKSCAFCNSASRKLSREHIYPYGLISKFPQFDHAFFGGAKAVKLSPMKQVINDVCIKCNNEELSALDEYGNKFILKYFSQEYLPNEQVNIEYNYPILSKWVMKILYNSLRKDESSYWLKQNSRYIIGESPETTSKFSLFLGLYVDLAPLPGMYPDLPFQGICNPTIFLRSRAFVKEMTEYKNDNIEKIYVLRLMNAIFVLVCWKEDKWEPTEEEILAGILPHKILRENQNSTVIERSTDCFNSGHLFVLSSKQAQRENDIYMNRAFKKGL